MKEGIHPNYREVLFVDLSNGFKFVTRSCVSTKEMGKTDDGRELPLFKLDTSSESHPFYTGTQKSVERHGRPRRASSSKDSARRPAPPPSKPQVALPRRRQPGLPRCPFSHLPPDALHTRPVNQPTPAIVAQSAVRRLPRIALLLLCAAYLMPRLRRPRAMEERRHRGLRLHGRTRAGRRHWRAGSTRSCWASRPSRRRCCPTGSAPGRSSSRRPGCTPDFAARIAFRPAAGADLAATWYAVYYLARTPAGAARGLRLRRRGPAHRLCAGHRRRRPAGADRLPGPGAAVATKPRRRWPSCSSPRICFYGVAALPYHRIGASSPCWSAASGWRCRGGPTVGLALRTRLRRRCSARSAAQQRRRTARTRATYSRGAVAAVLGATLLAGALGAALGLFQWKIDTAWQRPERAPDRATCASRPSCCCGSPGRPGRWRCGRSGAGAASWPAATWRCRCGSRWCRCWRRWTTAFSDRSLLLGAARAGHAGGVRAAHPAAQRGGADRLVHAAVLQRLRLHHLGDVDCDADRRAGQAGGQRGQAGARLRAQLLAAGLRSPRWPRRWPGPGWCAGAPAAIARASGRAWCCRPAARRCAGCC